MTKKSCFILITIISLFLSLAYAKEEKKPVAKLLVFHSPLCGRCVEVKEKILPKIEEEYQGKVFLEYLDLMDAKNNSLFLGLRKKYGLNTNLSLPVFFMEGSFLSGDAHLESNLRIFIDTNLAGPGYKFNGTGIDIVDYFKGIRPLVIMGAGLLDGINPCAFTVIVFFVSYLALQGYRKRELVVIGLSFLSAVFLTYISIGLGVFNALYRFKMFWLFAKTFNIIVGILSISLGCLALYDFLKFRKTSDTKGLMLQLPKALKSRIHSVIGWHYRKPKERLSNNVALFRLIISALITGFLVSLLEAVCTGQLYLPTIAFVLKTTPLKLQAFSYLIIYNIMFIVPLLLIFVMALLGVTSLQFSVFLKKNLSAIKVAMAALFFSLGLFLLLKGGY